jgi:hypothetical protein
MSSVNDGKLISSRSRTLRETDLIRDYVLIRIPFKIEELEAQDDIAVTVRKQTD